MPRLVLCEACCRHYRPRDRACPFCGADSARRPVAGRSLHLRGAGRSRRYQFSVAVLAGAAAAVACGKTRSSTMDGDAGDSSIDGAMHGGGTTVGGAGSPGTAGNGVIATGGTATGATGAGGSATGGIPVIIATTGGRPEPTGVVAGNGGGVLPTGRACPDFQDRIGCRKQVDCPPSTMKNYETNCVPNQLLWDDCGRPRAGMVLQCEPACEDGELCMPDGFCGHRHCRPPCPDVPCDSTMRCDATGICIPRGCEEDGGSVCGDDQVCDPTYRYASSHCVALKCNDGFECQPWQACGTSGGDSHGCYARACQIDEDCGCGYCVNAQCSPMLGECHEEYLALPYGCVWPDEEWV